MASTAHHHYHSTAHEVLGITAGSVRVRLGGESGRTVEVRAGDVVIIPAGVAHKNEGASPDLIVVGAYPEGKSPDMCRPSTQDRERVLRNISRVPLPAFDPVTGKAGPTPQPVAGHRSAPTGGRYRDPAGYRQRPV